MIIGICGLIGSGKGTVADMLQEDYGFTKMSFADSLKDMVSVVFGWPRHLLEGDTAESREWRERIDPWWAEALGMPNLTPRWILQYWGTEVCRRGFHDDLWVISLKRKLLDGNRNIVIPDTRFPNEMAAIRDMGGSIWRITRGEDPDWFKEYQATGDDSSLKLSVHPSEYMWARSQFDKVLHNDGNLADLRETLTNAVRSA